MRPTNSRTRRRGFTLVEMVVAVLLLAIGVVAALVCISTATQSTSIGAEHTAAALLAQQRLSEIEATLDQLSAGEQEGDFGADHPGFRWIQSVETTPLSSVLKVTLTVLWPGKTAMRTAQFVTYETIPATTIQ